MFSFPRYVTTTLCVVQLDLICVQIPYCSAVQQLSLREVDMYLICLIELRFRLDGTNLSQFQKWLHRICHNLNLHPPPNRRQYQKYFICDTSHHTMQKPTYPTSKPGIRTTELTLRADHKITTDGQYNIRTWDATYRSAEMHPLAAGSHQSRIPPHHLKLFRWSLAWRFLTVRFDPMVYSVIREATTIGGFYW